MSLFIALNLPGVCLVCGRSGVWNEKSKILSFAFSAHLLSFPGILHGPDTAEHDGEPGPSECLWWSYISGRGPLCLGFWLVSVALEVSEVSTDVKIGNGQMCRGVFYPTRGIWVGGQFPLPQEEKGMIIRGMQGLSWIVQYFSLHPRDMFRTWEKWSVLPISAYFINLVNPDLILHIYP